MVVNHLGNARLGRRHWRTRGFRLCSGRLCVIRLRFRLLTAFHLLFRCLRRLLKKNLRRWRKRRSYAAAAAAVSAAVSAAVATAGGGGSGDGSGVGWSARFQEYCVLRVQGRPNSFYAEAVAECLEFIRRTSVPAEDATTTAGVSASGSGGGGGGR